MSPLDHTFMQAYPTQRDYWFAQLAGWGALTLLGLVSSSSGDTEQVIRFAMGKTFCMVTGLGLSHLWRLHLKRRHWLHDLSAPPFGPLLAGMLLLALVQTGCLLFADLLFRDGRLLADESTTVLDLVLLVFLWFSVFVVWTLCYAVALARRRALHAELAKLELEVSVKDAELRALQFQVNPHFFFNSLNSIRALIYADPSAAAHAVSQLASMMRQRLKVDSASTVPLGDEMAAVSSYLDIEKLRFDERLQVSLEIDPGLVQTPVPPMVVQTLVENAVKHGVERMVAPCQVEVRAMRGEDGSVRIVVRNQGTLAASSASTRLGLTNARRRLALQCGPEAGCELVEEEGWVRATVTVPGVAA